MKVRDVMTTCVYTVAPDTSVAAIARLLVHCKIGGVPVVDAENRVLGIVSESDLMRRAETGTTRPPAWWRGLVASTDELAADYVKTHGTRAAAVMTAPAVTVDEDADLASVAQILEHRRIRRVPVLRGGRLVGIISRANLLKGLLDPPAAAAAVSDRAIQKRLTDELHSQPWANLNATNIIVSDGVVQLWAVAQSEHERNAMLIAAESIPGVVRVENHIAVLALGV